jgi:hypothetical protein
MRVYELAKKLKRSNKDVLEELRKHGVDVKSHMSLIDDSTANTLTEQWKEEDDIVEPEEESWGASWDYRGPQHIPEEVKDERFTYGWVNYLQPGRLSAAASTGWQVDTEIRNKMTHGFDLPGRGPASPIEGAMIVGESLLVRKPKDLAEKQYKAEQEKVVEPEKAAKTQMKQNLIKMGIPPEMVEQIVQGEVKTSVM